MYSFCKFCRRSLTSLKKCNSLTRNYSETLPDYHVYDRVLPWKSNREFADYLCENIVHDKEGLIVLNKPYGVSFSKDGLNWKNVEERKKTFKPVLMHRTLKVADPDVVSETNMGFLQGDNINLHAALPFIQDNINNGKTLRIVRVPEKYTSGPAILVRDEKVEMRIKKCFERIKAEKLAGDTYLAIVSGQPLVKRIDNLRIGVKLEISKNKKQKKAVLTNTYSKTEVLNSTVKLATVNSTLLSSGEDELASLIQLETNLKRWHFVRLFLTSHLQAPALGDHIFGPRVKKIMSEMLLIDPWNEAAATGRQKLDDRLLSRLGLEIGSEKYIPTMIHHSAVCLPGFFAKTDESLKIHVQPPDHFVWTASKLGLSMPKQYEWRQDEQVERISMKKAV